MTLQNRVGRRELSRQDVSEESSAGRSVRGNLFWSKSLARLPGGGGHWAGWRRLSRPNRPTEGLTTSPYYRFS